MTGLPIAPLLFFATPLIVLVLVLALLNLRNRVRRLEASLAGLEPRRRVTVTDAEPVPPDAPVSVTASTMIATKRRRMGVLPAEVASMGAYRIRRVRRRVSGGRGTRLAQPRPRGLRRAVR